MKECHMIESLILGSFQVPERKSRSLRLCLRMKEPYEAATSEARAKSVCGHFTYLCVYVHVSVSVHASVMWV